MFSNIRKMPQNIKNILLGEKRGSLVVEAAIFLPIFIIGMMTLGYLVKFNAVQENVFHSFADETGKLAAEASMDLKGPLFYENHVESRVKSENDGQIINTDLKNFRYKVPTYKGDNIISASIDYDIDIGLPAKIVGSIPASDSIVCRAFVGDEQAVSPMSFSEMEKSVDSITVWIFPKSGRRYHGEFCNYIINEPKERVFSSGIKSHYNPCKTCKPKGLSYGNLVYCFSTGNVYHRGECPTVTKYVISIEKKEAANRGYSACSRCGGS